MCETASLLSFTPGIYFRSANWMRLIAGSRLLKRCSPLRGASDWRPPRKMRNCPTSQDKRFVGIVATIRSFLASYSGDMLATIRYALQALAELSEQELEWRSGALIALGDAYASEGQMAAAHKARSEALATSKASGNIYILMIVNLSLAEVLRQQGNCIRSSNSVSAS